MKPVTGPDGDNPITDEQIRDVRDLAIRSGDIDMIANCQGALGALGADDGSCRARCADAYNTMHKETP